MASFQTLTFPGKEIPDVEGTITKILKLSTALNEKKNIHAFRGCGSLLWFT